MKELGLIKVEQSYNLVVYNGLYAIQDEHGRFRCRGYDTLDELVNALKEDADDVSVSFGSPFRITDHLTTVAADAMAEDALSGA